MNKGNGYMLLAFIAFCLAKGASETLPGLLHSASTAVSQVIDWDTAMYVLSAVGGLMLLGLPFLVLIWLAAKVWKWA